MSSKRQQTFAKMERERRVKDKRAQKQEKKQAAAAARLAEANGTLPLEVDEHGAPVGLDEALVSQDEASEAPDAPDAPVTRAPEQ
jgi:hypothetical protein